MEKLSKITNAIASVLLIVCTILATVNIVLRYIFNHALNWGDEGCVFLFIGAVYFAMCSVTYERTHLNTNVIEMFTSNKTLHLILRIFVVALTVAVSCFVVKAGIKPVRNAYNNGLKSGSGFFKLWIFYATVPVAFILNMISAVLSLFSHDKDEAVAEKDNEEEGKTEC